MPKATAASPSSKKDLRPTPDQMYLASKLNGDYMRRQDDEYDLQRYLAETEGTGNPGLVDRSNPITPAALQKWNNTYGVVHTTAALRNAWGFPPPSGISNPYAYVAGILRGTP